jgi:hypothetical protein
MHTNLIVISPALILLVICCGIFMTRSFARACNIPRCWKCGAEKVRRSHSSSVMDTAAAIMLLSPFRCSGCRTRFYATRFPRRFFQRPVA